MKKKTKITRRPIIQLQNELRNQLRTNRTFSTLPKDNQPIRMSPLSCLAASLVRLCSKGGQCDLNQATASYKSYNQGKDGK